MRVLLLAFLVCLPLAASEDPVLDRAVRNFRSDDADVREGASRLAHAHLQKVLAPLVAALEDPEPEVRRRARDAIRSLLPKQVPAPKAQPETAAGNNAFQVVVRAFNNVKGGKRFIWVAKRQNGQLWLKAGADDPKSQKAAALINKMGLEATPATKTLRKQLRLAEGQGFEVTSATGRAARLGLVESDLILRANGKIVASATDLLEALGEKPDWETVSFRVLRDGKPIKIGSQKT